MPPLFINFPAKKQFKTSQTDTHWQVSFCCFYLLLLNLTFSCERPYKCNKCSAEFAQKSNLTRHEMHHTGFYPNLPDFSEKIMTGEKPHGCDQCSATFADKSELEIHKRCHSGCFFNIIFLRINNILGEKPFKCNFCSASFARKNYLDVHERHHTGFS